MPIQAHPVDPWRVSRYVLGDEGKPLGPVEVSGLEEALEVISRAHQGNRITRLGNLRISSEPTSGANQWLVNWQRENGGTDKWDFIIRDNRNDRWVKISGAFFLKQDQAGSGTLSIDWVELVDGP